MGGLSGEREISLASGRAIHSSLMRQGYNAAGIDVDREIAAKLKEEKVGAAFLALHGPFGEDGTIQGLLEMMGIPYTGSGVLASAVGMNKVMTKHVLESHHLPTPRYSVLKEGDRTRLTLPRGFSFPVVVKPAAQGSTLGVSIVREKKEMDEACRLAFSYGSEVLVETFIEGREITVGILDERPLPVIEIVPRKGFYTYQAKYTPGATDFIVPASLRQKTRQKVQQAALLVHRAIGCCGMSRIDMRLGRDDEPSILEINTIPGMTERSLLPMAAGQAGISYDMVVELILKTALKRMRD